MNAHRFGSNIIWVLRKYYKYCLTLLNFRFQQLKERRKTIIGDLPLVSNDRPEACSSSVVKQICARHAYKSLRLLAVLRMNCVLNLSWRTMVFYDQGLTRLYNCDQFRKQFAFRASMLSEMEFPLQDLDCTCAE